MRLYIDKENLLSFISSGKNPALAEIFMDCRRILKRHVSVCYNFTKAEAMDNPELSAWFTGHGTQGCGKAAVSRFMEEKFPPRPVKCNFCSEASRPDNCAVYLIADDVKSVCNTHTLLIGSIGDEVSVLRKLMCNDDYQFHKGYDIRRKEDFSGWDQLDRDGHILPTTDIIVVDRYIFGGRNDVQDVVLEHNLYKIIEMFGSKKGSRVNVVFLTYGIRNKSVWQSRKSRIEQIIRKFNRHAAVNVTFVFYPDHKHEDIVVEHDRMIITNYRVFDSGDSFAYYDSKGRLISNGSSLAVNSTAESDQAEKVESTLERIENTCKAIYRLNPDLIIGDMVSSFINFRA